MKQALPLLKVDQPYIRSEFFNANMIEYFILRKDIHSAFQTSVCKTNPRIPQLDLCKHLHEWQFFGSTVYFPVLC